MSILDKKGISVTSGFKLVSGQPLDARVVVDDLDGLQDLIDNGAVYEGIVVYVKSEQQLKQYNGSEWCDISGGIVEDVEELPSLTIESQGAVPNSGYVEKVYFNTSLSESEVETLLKQLTYTNGIYIPLYDGTANAIGIGNMGVEGGLVIMNEGSGSVYWANQIIIDAMGAQAGITTAGWQSFTNPIEINSEVISMQDNDGDGTAETPIATQNELIKDLFYIPSSSPNPDLDLSKIYRVANYSAGGGSVVPNSGTVSKVYFNTAMSNSEVESLMALVESPYGCLVTNDMSVAIVLVSLRSGSLAIMNEATGEIYWANQTAVDNYGSEFGITQAGWQEFDNPIEINSEVISEADGLSIGVDNELIKDLFYTEPLVEPKLSGYNYYRLINKTWVEVLKETGEKLTMDDVNEAILKYMSENYDNGNTEEF